MNTYIPNLPQGAVQKLPGLLYMEYKVSELAGELGITPKTIYTKYIPAGLPHRKDTAGNIWIVGTEFAAWMSAILKQRPARKKMGMDEGYCARCKAPRRFRTILRMHELSAGRINYVGTCSVCGGSMTVIRGNHDRPRELEAGN